MSSPSTHTHSMPLLNAFQAAFFSSFLRAYMTEQILSYFCPAVYTDIIMAHVLHAVNTDLKCIFTLQAVIFFLCPLCFTNTVQPCCEFWTLPNTTDLQLSTMPELIQLLSNMLLMWSLVCQAVCQKLCMRLEQKWWLTTVIRLDVVTLCFGNLWN